MIDWRFELNFLVRQFIYKDLVNRAGRLSASTVGADYSLYSVCSSPSLVSSIIGLLYCVALPLWPPPSSLHSRQLPWPVRSPPLVPRQQLVHVASPTQFLPVRFSQLPSHGHRHFPRSNSQSLAPPVFHSLRRYVLCISSFHPHPTIELGKAVTCSYKSLFCFLRNDNWGVIYI